MIQRRSLRSAPAVLNTADKAMWVTGWNEAVDALEAEQAANSRIAFLYEELRKATDGGSESMTHDDALKQIAYWRDKDEQAQAVEPVQRHLPENVARLLIEHYLKDDHGYDEGGYTIEKQGDSAHESHIWAFWIFESDSTSYLHEDGKIEWCGTSWEPIERAQAVEPTKISWVNLALWYEAGATDWSELRGIVTEMLHAQPAPQPAGDLASLISRAEASMTALNSRIMEPFYCSLDQDAARVLSDCVDMLEAGASLTNEGNKAQQVAVPVALAAWLQWCLDNCDDSPEYNFGTDATEHMRALLAGKPAPMPPAQGAKP